MCPHSPLVPPWIARDDPQGEFATKEVKAKVNSTVVLECETWAVPQPSIRWYKDRQVRTWLSPGRSCLVWRWMGRKMPFVWLPGLCPTPGRAALLLLSCFCPASGLGSLQLLGSAGHLQILSEGQVLQIHPAALSDSGHYTCVATNSVGEDDRDFIVQVQGEPWVGRQWVGGPWRGPLREQSRLSALRLLGRGRDGADALLAPRGAVPTSPTADRSLSPQCPPSSRSR